MAKHELDILFLAEKAARIMIEEASADGVVIMWTSQNKRSTKFFRHQIGNAMLCDAMVEKCAEEQRKFIDEPQPEEEDD